MKKTYAMIYRFIFILFSMWGIFRKIGFNLFTLSPLILDFTLFIDILSFVCIFVVFIISITRHHGKIIGAIKALLTFCNIIVFVVNFDIITSGITYSWVLGILLPVMMVLDWLLFDKKGDFNYYDPLLWILGTVIAGLGLAALLKYLFGIDNFALGLFDNFSDLLKLLFIALGIGAGMFLLDSLISAFNKKGGKNLFSLVFRLVFILLEIYALFKTIGFELTTFLYKLGFYHILINFLCFVFIAVTLIYNIVRFKGIRKRTCIMPRMKGALALCMGLVFIIFMFLHRDFHSLPLSELILYVIAPVMFLLDWVMFDEKGYFALYDPLIWSIVPISYYCFVMVAFPSAANLYGGIFLIEQAELILSILTVSIVSGYVVYIADRIFSK